jgi:hypothetical protein
MASFRRFFFSATALVALATSACSSTSERRFIIGGGGERSREIRVEVVNDNFLDMGVFVMEGATNFRLGDVTGKNSATFTLNLDQISPSGGLRLLADPVGSREAYLSDAVAVNPGVIVVFHIAPALSQSYVILR